MEFRLIFDGDLRPRRRCDIEDIHKIRLAIHPQMQNLWQHEPLVHSTKWLQAVPVKGDLTARDEVDGQPFISIVSKGLFTQAELDVLLLRAQPPGQLITNQGDIDNRMKTLFDGLRIPTKAEAKELRGRGLLANDMVYCLMQDDALVSKLTVTTDRLLGEPLGSNRTLAIINVKLRPTRVAMGNIGLVA